MIQRLQTEFVPVVGDTHLLQDGRSEAARWFQKMAGRVNPRLAKNETAQGFYIFAADGTAYGFNNNRTVERVSQFMDAGLRAHRENLAKQMNFGIWSLDFGLRREPVPIQNPNSKIQNKETEGGPPAGTTVVRVFSRIRPLPAGAGEANARVGRDHLWISGEEVETIRASPRQGAFPLPPALVARLVRFHLVDNVRGEPDMWTETDVRRADFSARVETAGENPVVAFTGDFAMQTADGKRGYEGKIEGRIVIGGGTGNLDDFYAYAEGQAWGVSTYTPGAPEGRFPLVIALIKTNDGMAQVTPPQAAACGHAYWRARIESKK